MAHFAEIDDNNIVVRILVVPDEQEHRGAEYLATDLDLGGQWIQTSYNGNIKYNFAAIGYSYDNEADAFIPPKPLCNHSELNLNENKIWICSNTLHENDKDYV